jgi:putative phage-type endonuclease
MADHPPSWYARRRRGLGASEIATILHISPYRDASEYALWQSKITGGSDFRSNEKMRWGNLLENVVVDETARRLGVTVTGRQVAVEHPNFPWAIAILDATYEEPEDEGGGGGLIEVKTTGDRKWDEVPRHYAVQVQWQLAVRGCADAWVGCLHQGQRLSLWHVEADPELGAALLRIGWAWWRRHVLGGEPPEVDASPATAAAIDRRYPAVPGLTADLGELRGHVRSLHEIRAAQRVLKRQAAQLENEVRAALGNADEGQVDGQTVITWRPHTRRDLDRKKLRDEQPVIADKYTVTRPVRPLRLTGTDDEGDDEDE